MYTRVANSQQWRIHAGVVQTLDSAIHGINQWISIGETDCTIHWIEIYTVDSVIHLLNNWGPDIQIRLGGGTVIQTLR